MTVNTAQQECNRPVVVLSDMHFGRQDSTLTEDSENDQFPYEHRRVRSALFNYLKGLQPIGELLLLGDVFDIWRFGWEGASDPAAGFLLQLGELDIDRIGFTCGNHDHPFLFSAEDWRNNVRRDGMLKNLSANAHSIVERFIRPLFPKTMKPRLFGFYPFYARFTCGQFVVFHHGHYLKYLPLVSCISSLQRLRFHATPDSILEMEERWTMVFQAFRRMGLGPSVRNRVHDFLQEGYSATASRLHRGTASWEDVEKPGSWMRNQGRPTIKGFVEDVHNLMQVAQSEGYLHLPTGQPIAAFIFGHTHCGEIWQPPEGRTPALVNTGCWVSEDLLSERALNTFSVIHENRVDLVQIRNSGASVLDSLRLGVQS